MAVVLRATADYLGATSDLPPITTFTLMAWFNADDFDAGGPTFFSFSTGYSLRALPTGGGDANPMIGSGGYGAVDYNLTLAPATWIHAALVVRGTGAGQVEAWFDGVQDAALTYDGDPSAVAQALRIGSIQANDPWWRGRIAFAKVWGVALSGAEILQEMRVGRPVRTASLWGWYPILPGSGERGRDYSGLGHNLTENGTLIDGDHPPVSFGLGSGWTVVAVPAPPQGLAPSGIPSEEVAGVDPALALTVIPGGIDSAEASGAPSLDQAVVIDGIASEEAHSDTAALALAVLPAAIPTAEAHGPAILQLAGELALPGIDSEEAAGSPTLTPGPVTLAPSGVPSEEAGGQDVRAGIGAHPGGIPSAEANGTPSLAVGPTAVAPSGVQSEEAVGIPSDIRIANILAADGIPGEEAFGEAVLGATVRVDGAEPDEAFGLCEVRGRIGLAPGGIGGEEALGIPDGAGGGLVRELGSYVRYEFRVEREEVEV